MQNGANRSSSRAASSRADVMRSEVNMAIVCVLRYMSGDLSLTEAAARAELPRSVVTELSSDLAGYILPRALRSLRHSRGQSGAGDERECAITNH